MYSRCWPTSSTSLPPSRSKNSSHPVWQSTEKSASSSLWFRPSRQRMPSCRSETWERTSRNQSPSDKKILLRYQNTVWGIWLRRHRKLALNNHLIQRGFTFTGRIQVKMVHKLTMLWLCSRLLCQPGRITKCWTMTSKTFKSHHISPKEFWQTRIRLTWKEKWAFLQMAFLTTKHMRIVSTQSILSRSSL